MPALPEPVRAQVERALADLGASGLSRIEPVAGGCINRGARLETTSGAAFFLKWNPSISAGVFEAEVDGLRALRGADALRVPEPLAWGGGGDAAAWLIMEQLAPRARPGPTYDVALGRGLAALHGARAARSPPGRASDRFGWHIDNWIGSLTQSNRPAESWADFWRDERIVPQLATATNHGYLMGGAGQVMDALVDVIGRALADVDGAVPSLLHGDLWSGNAYPGPEGEPVIIDPAVYRGHAEVDLAMTELFGGFGAGFYGAYRESRGISEAYDEYRRDLYQLYYLLVHVNLFGTSYEPGAVAAARRVLAALG